MTVRRDHLSTATAMLGSLLSRYERVDRIPTERIAGHSTALALVTIAGELRDLNANLRVLIARLKRGELDIE